MDHPAGGRGVADPLGAVEAVHRHRTQQHLDQATPHDTPPSISETHHRVQVLESYDMASDTVFRGVKPSYKELKEAWIADQTGSSVHFVNTLGLVMLLSYAIWAVLRAKRLRFVHAPHRPQTRQLAGTLPSSVASVALRLSDWQLEFLILIVPAVGAHTVLASQLVATNCALFALLGLLLRSRPPLPGKSRSDKSNRQKRHWSKKGSDNEDSEDQEAEAPTVQGSVDTVPAETEMPFRVSVDSAADAAHAAAAPPTFYDGPGSSLRSDTDLTVDNFMTTAPSSPALDSTSSVFASRSADGSLLSPVAASISSLPSSTRPELTTLKTQLLHSRDASDGQSVVSATSAMSPLARSVVDPWGKAKQQSPFDHLTSSPDESIPRQESRVGSVSSSPSLTTTSSPRKQNPSPQDESNLFVRPQPFLTVYRAHMMLVTIISILAVDFPVFPRLMSKCESWGTSWMDMGVGSFVFSLGIISALPFLKSPRNRFRPLRQQLISDFRRSLPLFLLGSVRVIMVKGVEYPEHVSEYGVHWNFFITLAMLPFAATLSRPFSRFIRYSVLGLGLALSHQVLLTSTQWQAWALSNTIPRTDFWTQNKEGVTSIFGYLAIFYIGLDLGHYVLPLDPYFAYRKLRKRRARPRTEKLAMVLASLAILWWVAYAATYAVGLRTSRRLANLPYVLWVAAFNTSFLLCYVLVYKWILQPAQREGEEPVTPRILEDLNRHSLTVFLAANLLTGLVNVSVKTMYTRDWMAVMILLGYTGACCALAHELSRRGMRLRL